MYIYYSYEDKHLVLDITNMKIKQKLKIPCRLNIKLIYIESKDILVKAFKDRIMIYNKELKLVSKTIFPYSQLNKTRPE